MMGCLVVTQTSASAVQNERRRCFRVISRSCGRTGCFVTGVMCPILIFVIYSAVLAGGRSHPDAAGTAAAPTKMPIKMAKMYFRKPRPINASSQLGRDAAGRPRALPVIKLPVANGPESFSAPKSSSSASFSEAVLRYTCPYTGSIVLSPGGYGYADMAVNLYKTSYERFNVRNHLFVGSDEKFCSVLRQHGAHCVKYFGVHRPGESSTPNGTEFPRKTYTKVGIVKDAILLNVTVLLVDLDIVFFRNPLLYLGCDRCDVMMQSDGIDDKLDTGFYLMKPTTASVVLLKQVWAMIRSGNYSKLNEQQVINSVLADMRRKKEIRLVTLDMNVYPDGNVFFKDSGRVFKGDSPCRSCIIVHNNGIVTKEAKRYRFKEYGLWAVDTGGYYSDPNRKYLAYANPTIFASDAEMKKQELRSLRSALLIGHVLNRTVILPEFHRYNKVTNILPFVDMPKFDANLASSYREHVFLSHSLVPHRTRNRVSQQFLLRPLNSTPIGDDVGSDVTVKRFRSSSLSVQQLITWFRVTPALVLRFHSLYIDIMPSKVTENFSKLIDKALS